MSGLAARYAGLVEAGELRPDAEQAAAVEHLTALQSALEREPDRPGLFSRLFGAKAAPEPRGVYM
ncbi:MAG: hypothetical protein B7X57_08015, partial [Erythrobacter sp. 34-65-8]